MTFDRCSGERNSSLADLSGEAGAEAIVCDGTRFGIDGARLARVPARESTLFLGRNGGAPLFLEHGESPSMLDFRGAAAILPPDEMALLSYAQGMLNWAKRTKFCSACGTALEPRQAGYSRKCPNCELEIFPRIDPAVMILATHRDRILLARHHGYSHAWSTLAGFVEPGETLEQAVARELLEETGLVAASIRYYGSQPWPLPSSLMIGFEVEPESDAIAIDPAELLEARWFAREELETITTSAQISLSGQMIAAWRS